jgi:hypothetical protein
MSNFGIAPLCMYVIPRSVYDTMFPITIEPKPDQLVRVGMVFQKLNALDWLPRLRTKLERLHTALESKQPAEVTRARNELNRFRALARDFLVRKNIANKVRYKETKLLVDQWDGEFEAKLTVIDREQSAPVLSGSNRNTRHRVPRVLQRKELRPLLNPLIKAGFQKCLTTLSQAKTTWVRMDSRVTRCGGIIDPIVFAGLQEAWSG